MSTYLPKSTSFVPAGTDLGVKLLSLTSDRVYRWQLLLEEFAPKIVYIKGIHNSVADAISRLDYNLKVNLTSEFNYSTLGVPAKGETPLSGRPSQSSGVVILNTTQAIQHKNAT